MTVLGKIKVHKMKLNVYIIQVMGQINSKLEESDDIEIESSWSDTLFIRPRPIKNCCKLIQKPPSPTQPIQKFIDMEEDDRYSEHPVSVANAFTDDTIVNTVIHSFIDRSNLGFKKYGKTLDRTDVTSVEWANHMQEELMDAILYLERLKQDLTKTAMHYDTTKSCLLHHPQTTMSTKGALRS